MPPRPHAVPPPPKDELEDDPPEEEEEEEEEEEDEEPEAVRPAPPLAPPPVVATPIPEPSYRPSGGKKRKAGIGAPPKTAPRFADKDADAMWTQILAQLAESGHSPFEVQILVEMPGTERPMKLGTIDGGTVSGGGSVSPGEALVHRLEDSYHLVGPSEGPVTYTCKFQWKANGQPISTGMIYLPSKRHIMAIREQGLRDTQAQSNVYGPPPGMGRPLGGPPQYGQPWPSPYGAAQPPPQYYPQPQAPQAPQQVDPYVRQSIEMLTGLVNELRLENAQLRNQPPPAPMVMPPIGIAAPPPHVAPPQASMEELVERAVTRAVQVIVPALRPQGTGAPVASTPSMEAEMLQHTQSMIRDGFQQFMGAMFKARGKDAIAGLGAPQLEEMPAPDPISEVVEPPNPQDALPFTQVPLEAKFSDGRPVIYPVDKETGNVNVMGAIFANPFVMEKMADGVNALTTSLADAIKKVGAGGPHVVSRTPGGARDANPQAPPDNGNKMGSGWD